MLAHIASGEEGGSGHYFPGSMSSFVDGVPAEEALITRLNVLSYSGSVDSDLKVPIAGLAAVDVDVESFAVGLTALWRPPGAGFGNWSYAAAITVPFVSIEVEANVVSPNDPLARTLRRSDTATGLGDILLLPVMFNYALNPALNANFRLGIYAPTGDYELGALANQGKNYWTFEPIAALIYLNPKNGFEASGFLGLDFNTENSATDYNTGTQAHFEGTLAQHLPLWGGSAGIGITGFWYQQLQGDSGDGATFGDFKARALGIGPVISYVQSFSNHDFMAAFKWLHEQGVERRPEGDTLFLKLMLKF